MLKNWLEQRRKTREIPLTTREETISEKKQYPDFQKLSVREAEAQRDNKFKEQNNGQTKNGDLEAINTQLYKFAEEGLNSIRPYHPWPTLEGKSAGDQASQDAVNQLDWKIRVENETRAWRCAKLLNYWDSLFKRPIDSNEFKEARSLFASERGNDSIKSFKEGYEKIQSLDEKAKNRIKDLNGYNGYLETLSKKPGFFKPTVDGNRSAFHQTAQEMVGYLKEISKNVENYLEQMEGIIKEPSKNEKGGAKQDTKDLKEFIGHLKDLKNALGNILNKEKGFEEEIKTDSKTKGSKEAINRQKDYVNETRELYEEAQKKLTKVKDSLNQAYSHLEKKDPRQEAIELLDSLAKKISDEKIGRKEQQPCLYMDTRGWVSVKPGHWLPMRKLWKFLPVPGEKKTVVKFRPDLVPGGIRIYRESRNSNMTTQRDPYIKNLENWEITADDYDISFKIPETFNDSTGRRVGTLTVLNKKGFYEAQKDPNLNKGNIDQLKKEYTVVKQVDMEKVQNIDFVINLVNEKDRVPHITCNVIHDVMPDAVINHDDIMKSNDGGLGAYGGIMAKINLATMELTSMDEAISIPFGHLDLTESQQTKAGDFHKPVPGNDLVVRLNGPTENSYIRLDTAFSVTQKTKVEEETKRQINNYLEKSIKDLKNSIHHGSQKEDIENAFSKLEKDKWIMGITNNMLKQNFYGVPRDKLQFETFSKTLPEKLPLAAEKAQAYRNEATAMQQANLSINRKMYDSLIEDLKSKGKDGGKEILPKWLNAERLDQKLDSRHFENPLEVRTLIMEIAKDAGKAAYEIEKVKTKDDNLAENAQKETEDKIFNEINDTTLKLKGNKQENIDDLRSKMQESLYHATFLEAKAEAVKAIQESAKLLEKVPEGDIDAKNEKESFVEAAKVAYAEKEEKRLLKYIEVVTRAAIENRESGPTKDHKIPTKDNRVIDDEHKKIKKVIEAKIKEAKNKAESEIKEQFRSTSPSGELRDEIKAQIRIEQAVKAVEAARKVAIEQLGGKKQFDDAKKLPILLLYTGAEKKIENEEEELEKGLKKVEEEAGGKWENEYGLFLAKKAIESIEEAEKTNKKTAYNLSKQVINNLKNIGTISSEKLNEIFKNPKDLYSQLEVDGKLREKVANLEKKAKEAKSADKPVQELLNKYEACLNKPNPDATERAFRKKVEEFFEKKEDGEKKSGEKDQVHDYWRNQYYLKRAIDAARRGQLLLGDDSARDYIMRMKLVPEPDRASNKPEQEHLREGFEHDWVLFLRWSLGHALDTDSNEVVGHALTLVDSELKRRYRNIKIAENAINLNTSPEQKIKALGEMKLTADSLLKLNPGEEVTNPYAALEKKGKEILAQHLDWEETGKKSKAELAEEQKVLDQYFARHAQETYKLSLAWAQSDPELYANLKANSTSFIQKQMKLMWTNYDNERTRTFHVQQTKFQQKEATKWFWRSFWQNLGLLQLRGTLDFGSRADKEVQSALWGLIKKVEV